MEETPLVQSEPRSDPAPSAERSRRGVSLSNVLSFVVGLVGIAALGAAAWVYADTQRDIRRMSTDIAQIRLSLELFGRQQPGAASTSTTSNGELQDIANRLSILEQSWRSAPAAALPAVPDAIAPSTDAPVATGGDCLPPGTRFMVAAGDSYPICGTSGKVQIGSVDDGFLTLGDGTVIAEGGTIGLAGTKCMIGMVPSEGGSISGFAEIRVVC